MMLLKLKLLVAKVITFVFLTFLFLFGGGAIIYFICDGVKMAIHQTTQFFITCGIVSIILLLVFIVMWATNFLENHDEHR